MQPTIYYCYDAYCGWCYGFSPVIKRLTAEYENKIKFKVLSGGMIPKDNARHISSIASYIQGAYRLVEEMTGIKFGDNYLWHIFNPDQSDWYQHSEKSAAALCIMKEIFPERQVAFSADLQYALHYEGRDLTDDEAYRHLLHRYSIAEDDFYKKLNSEEYREKAGYEFALCRQLQATSFPQVLIQVAEQKFYLLAKGYTDFETLKSRTVSVLAEVNS
ncbi:MAG: DsbA family protein [Chitinophagaceae bacterium]|nr:DsbA family protein [Chitinophagaceae bacterium]MBK8951951.1 DsbA family protein [Chitinophagaceae bacterium]